MPDKSQPVTTQRKKIGFVSLGCPKNLVDSEVMMGLLTHAGAEITPRAEEADVIVVNTCSFIETAKQESVDAILEMAQLKIKGIAQKLVVAGCLVERYRDEIRKNIPEVDAVVGTGELNDILLAAGIAQPDNGKSPFTILTSAAKAAGQNNGSKGALVGQERKADSSHAPNADAARNDNSPIAVSGLRPEGVARAQQGRFSREEWGGVGGELPKYLYDETTPRVLATPAYSAYIKIAEGCDHPCAFCIIPQLRGQFRSRRFESVIAEAEQLARVRGVRGEASAMPTPLGCEQLARVRGVREITLIGQDTTCYGEDLGLKDGLALLLERLAKIEELRWVRFLYAYPNKITGKLLDVIAGNEKICSYIDVPLQHASGSVLRRMKRGGGAEIFLKSIEKMRRTIPDLTLRTSFIVGFPGETESDFDELCRFVREVQFDWMGVFGYSDEEGAGAFKLGEKIAPKEIERRKRKLMQMQKTISRRKKKALVGREFDLLLEGPSSEIDLLWEGRTPMHAPEIDGKVYVNDFGDHADPMPGEFHRARITEAHEYDLVAELV